MRHCLHHPTTFLCQAALPVHLQPESKGSLCDAACPEAPLSTDGGGELNFASQGPDKYVSKLLWSFAKCSLLCLYQDLGTCMHAWMGGWMDEWDQVSAIRADASYFDHSATDVSKHHDCILLACSCIVHMSQTASAMQAAWKCWWAILRWSCVTLPPACLLSWSAGC